MHFLLDKHNIAFAITMPNVTKVLPNIETHKEFADTLQNAIHQGVKIIYLPCVVQEDSVDIIGYETSK